MGKSIRLISQCRGRRRRRRRGWIRVFGRRCGEGGARSRVWSARPDPGEHHLSGLLFCSFESPTGQRATAAPTEDEARGPAQSSANAVPPSGHDPDHTAGIKHTTYRPSTSARHANLPACPNPRTSAAHLRHHGRGIGHGT